MRASVVHRTRPARRRTVRPMAGQLFEIRITRDDARWAVSIPEIDVVAHVPRRADAEITARRCIAVHTGIPIGYVAVWDRD